MSSISSFQSLLGHSEKAEYYRSSVSGDSDIESATSSTILQQQQQQKAPASSESGTSSSKFIDGRTISDAIIGLSDGLTVPFALTAGLSALEDTKVVVFGGLAELIAGAISMGLGGYLGAKSEM